MQELEKVCAYCLRVRSCGLDTRDDERLLKLGTVEKEVFPQLGES